MIVSRTPLRISFLGGGSDLPIHYRRYGGAVISAAFAQYVYVAVNRRFDSSIRISYSITEEVEDVSHIRHNLVRAALLKLGVRSGVEITSIADIPSRGTGLGSSSAFTAGLLHALHAHRGHYRAQAELAAEACEVEIDLCKEPVGKQDQYAAAMGGVNLFRFNSDDTVSIEKVIFTPGFARDFQDSMLLFYTGRTRSASEILERQISEMSSSAPKTDVVCRMACMTEEFRCAIDDCSLTHVGELLHEGWRLKRSLTDQISNPAIDDMYAAARRAGAFGGKLLGAGGGGFLLICAPPDSHRAIRQALADYKCLRMRIDWSGTSIILYSPQEEDPAPRAAFIPMPIIRDATEGETAVPAA
jgi:D-glycero-alpha-D-manno-heptose-7-phosphate kinase